MQHNHTTNRLLICSIFLLLILSACSSKRFVNKALKYDEAGMYQEAAALYKRSLESNQTNIEARMGLTRTGNLVLEEKLKNFSSLYRNNQHKEAVYAYLNAEKYYNEIASVGVKLDLSEQYRIYYSESKEKYLSFLYEEGVKALNIEAFETAEPLLAEILSIDNAYKDTHEHWITAKYEPLYRSAINYSENGLHRKAYYAFDKIIKEIATYKESLSYKEQSLKAATITIGVLPFYANEHDQIVTASELRAKTINDVQQLKTPFYKLINDPVINSIPRLEKVSNPQAALTIIQAAGANISVQSVLHAKIIRLTKYTSSLSKAEKPAYLKKVTEITNQAGVKETVTNYVKTTYLEYTQQSKALITIEFSLVKLNSGEIMATDAFTFEDSDNLNYAEYKGDYKELIPGEWKKRDAKEESDKIYDDSHSISQLHQKFTTKNNFRDSNKLLALLVENAALRIAQKIEQYNPEK